MTSLAPRIRELLPKYFATMCDLDIVRAQGAYVYDAAGNVYLDFACSSSATNLGHRHPDVQSVLHKQLDQVVHTFFQQLPYSSYLDLVEILHQITPGSFPKKTVLNTTGGEAAETAVRIARAATQRDTVVSFSGSFHGRTFLCSGLSNNTGGNYHVPDVVCAPFIDNRQNFDPDAYTPKLISKIGEFRNCAAFIIEPVQGESGFNVANTKFLTWLREFATTHGIVLIVDEIQCGLARTGKMFAVEHYGIEPDILLLSKTLGGGLPLSAVIGRADIMDAPTTFGGTFSGAPLAVAAAIKVLALLQDEEMCKNARALGVVCSWHLARTVGKYPFVKGLVGLGSMLALDFDVTNYPGIVTNIQQRARQKGLILASGGQNKSRIRFLYPLIITAAELEAGLHILESVFEDITNELQPQ